MANKEEVQLLNVHRAASFLGVSAATIRIWAQTNKLKGVKVGSRGDWRFTKEELSKMIRVEKKKFAKIKKFLKENTQQIIEIAKQKHIQQLGTEHVRIKNLEKNKADEIIVIKEFANNLENFKKGTIVFERLAERIAKKSLKNGLTLEEAVDGTIFLKQAFWERLDQEGLLHELTTQDFYAFSHIITTYADIVASKIAFAFHDYYLEEEEKLKSVQNQVKQQEKELQLITKTKTKMLESQDFLSGGGEMGKLMRSFGWSKTAVGPIDQWPQSLRTAISIILNSSFPMFIWWGEKQLTNFYNDPYVAVLGKKHPQALGKSGKIAWKEIWRDIGPLAKQVFRTGKPIFKKDLPLLMNRNGYDELTYFTFSYSPIRDEYGEIAGMYCACYETTREVVSHQQLKTSENRFSAVFESVTDGIAVFDMKENLVLLNLAQAKINGYENVEDMKQNLKYFEKVYQLMYPDGTLCPLKDWPISRVYRGETFDNFELRGKRIDIGREWYFNFSGTPIYDEKGQPMLALVVTRDITAQKKAEEGILHSEQRFRLIAERMVDVITIHDRSFKYIYCSPSIESVLGKPPSYFVGKTYWELGMPKQQCEIFDTALETVFSEKKTHTITYGVNDQQYFQSILIPEFDGNGEVQSVLIVSRDISQLKEAQKRKDDFISIASHELKTPITTLKAYTQILQKRLSQADKKDQYLINSVSEQADRLTYLLNDLLNVSKLEAGKLELSKEKFDLEALIRKTMVDFQYATNSHTIKIEGGIKDWVIGDKNRIEQVLANLLTNAVKYSPSADRVIVKLTKNGRQAVVSVQDFGMGITKKEQKKVFERFYRTKDKETSTISGFGLGLYISSEIIKRHSGKIWVESSKGKGSIFHFSLPLAK